MATFTLTTTPPQHATSARHLSASGARAVVIQAEKKDDPLSRWINRIRAERGYNKATVALANKMARMGWAVLHNRTTYRAAV